MSKLKKAGYEMLKAISKSNLQLFESYDVDQSEYVNILQDFDRMGYIKGCHFLNDGNRSYPRVMIKQIKITLAGEEYLSNNSFLAKAYDVVKDVAGIVR